MKREYMSFSLLFCPYSPLLFLSRFDMFSLLTQSYLVPHLATPAAGTNRALLCKSTVDGLQVTQLNVDHTTENEDELFRFSQLGECLIFISLSENILCLSLSGAPGMTQATGNNNRPQKEAPCGLWFQITSSVPFSACLATVRLQCE